MEMTNETNILTDPVQSATCPNCGATLDVDGLQAFSVIQCPTCQAKFQVPARFGPFLLLQLLGAGGMGGVYRAKDEALNREVAVKVMLKSLGDDPQFVESFQKEAQAAAKLNHPHIAQIYSFGQEKGQPYIAMELVNGGGLDKMMKNGPMDPATVIHIGQQIAEGLNEAAEAGLVHGDVKPENILFDSEKNAKLVDFGLAAMQGRASTEIWGTPYYISPEKCRRQKCDYRADIYSLGGTLYHAITGKPPFDGPDATAVVKARFNGPAKPLSQVRRGIKPEVDAMISRMLEDDPAKRYPTYGSLLGDMRRYLASERPVNLKVKSKKFVIKGHAHHVALPAQSEYGTGETAPGENADASLEPLPPGMEPVDMRPVEEEEEEDIGKRGCKLFALIGGGALLLIILIAVAILGILVYSGDKEIKTSYAAEETVQKRSRGAIQGYVTQADEFVKRLEPLPAEALQYAKNAADLVVEALGEEVRASMVPPEPVYSFPEEKKKAEEKPPAGTNAVAAAGGTNTVAAGGTNAVAGATNAVAGAAAPAPEAAEAAAPEGEKKPEENDPVQLVIKRVRGMYEEAYVVKGAVLYARKIRDEINELVVSAEKFAAPTEITEETVEEMRTLTKQLAELNKKVDDTFSNLRSARRVLEAARRVSGLKKKVDSIRGDLSALLAIRQQEKLAAEKKAKAEALAAKKAAEAEAHKEKVNDEKAKVAAIEEKAQEYLLKLDFRNASRILRDLTDELQTDEGKDFLLTARERVHRVEQFHTFMIKKCNEGYKSSKGWSTTAADKRNVTVSGKRVRWLVVYTKQPAVVMQLINELILSPKAKKEMKLSEHSRMKMNAALFMLTFYKDSGSAHKRALAIAKEAAGEFELDADQNKQLIPELEGAVGEIE